MINEVEKTSHKRFPKFDTAGWLSTGILFSLVLFADNLWSLISGWHDPFLPSQFGKIMGIIIGLGLGIHCVDMIAFHRRNQSFGKMN
jgi:hypothetical protein